MSRENVEVVIRSLHAFEAQERLADSWQEDGWITAPDGWPESGPFRGRNAVVAQLKRLAADWSEHRFDDIRVVKADGEWVVVEYRWVTRGVASGIETSFDLAAAYRVRDGLLAEAHFRWDRGTALEAAGLSE